MPNQPQTMEHVRLRVLALIAMTSCVAPPCVHANAITDVDQSLLSAIRIGVPPPPVAARDIAMVGIAMFDAVNAATGLNYRPYSYSGGAVAGASADVIGSSPVEDADELVYVVRGKSFMRYMVRKIVGTLLDVGRGKLRAADIPEIIEAKDRSRSGATAVAQGLYLVSVEYAEGWKL